MDELIPDTLIEELLTAADMVIITGARMRSDPGTHEHALAVLCGVMGFIAEKRKEGPPHD